MEIAEEVEDEDDRKGDSDQPKDESAANACLLTSAIVAEERAAKSPVPNPEACGQSAQRNLHVGCGVSKAAIKLGSARRTIFGGFDNG